VEFRILGDLEVVHDGRSVLMGGHQQRAVLAILVLHAGRVVSVDLLIEGLWGEQPPARAAKAVHVHMSRLRKALARDAASGELIVTRDHGYVLGVTREQVDVGRFERQLDEGRRAYAERAFERAAGVLRQALALWRGSALADFTFDAFAAGEIARLEELRLEALEIRVDADLALGRHGALVAELNAVTTEHPLRERLRAQQMLALYRCGREPDALAVYRQARRALVDELGVEPGPALRELHEAILRQDAALQPPSEVIEPSASVIGDGRRRRIRAVALASLVCVAGVAAVAVLSRGGASPLTVAANSVAVIDPARNAVVRQIAVGARPGDISVGAGGLWVANLDDRSVSQIDPKAARVLSTLSIEGRNVDALAAGAGAVWTTDARRATATQINPAFGDATRTVRVGPQARAGPGGAPSPVAVGGRSVWAATGQATVARIDPRSGAVDTKVVVGNEPAGIAVGGGSTWVADDQDNAVSRIDAAGEVTATVPVGDGASGIAVGDGAVWVANTLDNTVTRIDAATSAAMATIAVRAGPRGVAVGLGAVWVADSRDGTVSRIDPRTDHVQTIPVGGSPEAVAVAAGRAWVSVQAGSPPPASPIAGGALRVVQEKDFGSTDPALLWSYGPQAWQLEFATCAKLLNYPDRPASQGTRLVPEVASAQPSVSRDGRTYTFTLRPGFRFSPPSNQPVTARAFQRAIERFVNSRTGAATASDMADLVGYRAYRAGRSAHIAGLAATASRLTIRLVHAAPSLPARMAMPNFCAVPPDTPIRSGGVERIPSAGPYYIASHTPDTNLVLRRNPNYHGPRPRRFDTIDYRFGVNPAQAAALVDGGHADYADAAFGDANLANAVPPQTVTRLQRDYGRRSPAARSGRQRYFINRWIGLGYLLLNPHRQLFASTRMRRAVNFAVDRAALARTAGPSFSGLPTDQYLPANMPGFHDADIYPLGGPDAARARRLAGHHRAHAVMLTCDATACVRGAEIVKANLRGIGIRVEIKRLRLALLFERESTPGARYDIAWFGWLPNYADPSQFIDPSVPGFGLDFPGTAAGHYRHRIAATSKLTGQKRLRSYGQLDIDLATHLAPVISFADITAPDFFSARIGCQTFQPLYGMDLAALCQRGPAHRAR
jgi:YVTN family beta-propeller protein